jgi:hypothetical protein
LKLVFFVYETNGVIQERATILTPFQILRRKNENLLQNPFIFLSNTGWWRWCLIFWMVKTL